LSREKLLSHVGKDLLNNKLPQAPMTDLGVQIGEANWRIGLKKKGTNLWRAKIENPT
jgi:hypothetical protein